MSVAPESTVSDGRPGPLAGLRVVDCSTVLAGPYCTMLLADLGADVVKVEPPEGDATRGWGPPWVGEATGSTDAPSELAGDEPNEQPNEQGSEQPAAPPRTAAYYLAVNRNKRSIQLDLREAAGREVLRRLIERADVLVENFRAGSFERMGFGDEELERLNDGLVHLSISGYGRDGPDAGKPGYDFVLQAVAGLMSITGFADGEGGHATKVGVAISDVATGLLGTVGILAALAGGERRHASEEAGDRAPAADRRGQRVDVSILESTLAVLVNQAQNAFVTGRAPGRRGNAHPNIVPYETFRTADGEIAVAVGSERQWSRFCAALGMPALAADPRFATNAVRVERRVELRAILAERFASDATNAWIARLEGAEVPCGPINDVVAAFETPQARARGMVVDVEHPVLGALRQVGVPIRLSRTPASIRTAPPLLGEHSTEVLGELGYEPAEIARMVADRIV